MLTTRPLPSTISAFWQMVWEYSVGIVVMVTSEMEGGRVKCARYWPSEYVTYYAPTVALSTCF